MSTNINVYVKDAEDDSPIEGASVTITDPMNTVTNGSTTDSSGYSANALAPLIGDHVYRVKITKTNWSSAEFEVSGQVSSLNKVWLDTDTTMRITLKVVDSVTGSSVVGADIVISSTSETGPASVSGSTDSSGEATFTVVKDCDTYKITVTHPNYQTLRIAAASTATTFNPKRLKLTRKTFDTYGGTPPP